VTSLDSVPLFHKFSPNELKELEALTQRKRYSPGTAIFFQDDPSDSLYVVLSGSAKVFQTAEDGQRRVLNTLRKGEAFGELAMIEGQPRSATIEAIEESEMVVLKAQDFERFAESHPEVLWKLTQALCERVRQLMGSVLDMSFRDVPYRVLRVFQTLVQRHGVAEGDGWRINLTMGASDIASMVGANTETVGRLLDRYEKDGLIRRLEEKGWSVPDPRALEKALEYAGQ
jgi:CRP/FNR family transcriptional regulator